MKAESLREALRTRWLGRALQVLETTESTNADLRTWAGQDAPHGATIIARAQTAGRGRRGHRWHSPADVGLYASFLVRGPIPLEHVPLLTLAAALGAHQAIEACAKLDVGIRWPNDLLCRQSLRKLGGILVESSADESGLKYAIIGVGLNLLRALRPPPIDSYATSIEEAGGGTLEVDAVFVELAAQLERIFDELAALGGPTAMLEPYRQRALGIGQDVELIDDAGRGVVGRFVDLAADGALVLETAGGPVRQYAGMLRLPGAPLQPEW